MSFDKYKLPITIPSGGSITQSGAYGLTLTVTASTSVTLPTTGTLATTANISTHAALITGVHGLVITTAKTFTLTNSLTLSGTDSSTLNIGTGGTLGTAAYTASSAYEASGAVSTHAALKTGIHGITIASTFITSGAFALTLTTTEPTNVTLPASGILAKTTSDLNAKGNITGAATIDYDNGDYQTATTTGTVTGITISNLPQYGGMIIAIDNAGGETVDFGSTEIIAAAETGIYACAFFNKGGTIKFQGKGEEQN